MWGSGLCFCCVSCKLCTNKNKIRCPPSVPFPLVFHVFSCSNTVTKHLVLKKDLELDVQGTDILLHIIRSVHTVLVILPDTFLDFRPRVDRCSEHIEATDC